MPLPAATLTFDLLTLKPNQYVSRRRYIIGPNFGEISSDSYKYGILALIGWLYFSDKNYFLEESDYLSGKLPDKISS